MTLTAAETDPRPSLTAAEHKCLAFVAQGLQSKEIAELTGKAPKTIDKHIENACRKLGVRGRRQAIRVLFPQPAELRNGAVGAPFPLASPNPSAPQGSSKGGADAADVRTSPLPNMGGIGDHFGRSGGDRRGERSSHGPIGDDTIAFGNDVATRLDARDFLHRARSPLRERSSAEDAVASQASPVKRMVRIVVIAAAGSLLLAGLVGGSMQLQLAVQAADRLLGK